MNVKGPLIIHPDDRSTDFLSEIYEDFGYKVLRFVPEFNKLKSLLLNYDSIWLMGHGTPYGLLGEFSIIFRNRELLEILLSKKNLVCIWCNADKFVKLVRKNNLKFHGLATGMIISEVYEATYCGVTANQTQVNHANLLLSKCFRKFLHENTNLKQVRTNITNRFKLSSKNPVINYNSKNFHFYT